VLVLETQRLALFRLTLEDADFIVELLNDPGFLRFIGDRGVRTADDARKYLLEGPLESYERFGFGLFLVTLREDGTPVGICGLLKRDALEDVDVGFAFLPRFRGLGLASESAAAVLDYGREHFGLKRIVAITANDNAGSLRVLEKLGMKFERMIRMPGDNADVRLLARQFD